MKDKYHEHIRPGEEFLARYQLAWTAFTEKEVVISRRKAFPWDFLLIAIVGMVLIIMSLWGDPPWSMRILLMGMGLFFLTGTVVFYWQWQRYELRVNAGGIFLIYTRPFSFAKGYIPANQIADILWSKEVFPSRHNPHRRLFRIYALSQEGGEIHIVEWVISDYDLSDLEAEEMVEAFRKVAVR